MKKVADKVKWVSSSVVVIALLGVFWVWPAWNAGSQDWYFGNDGNGISTMFRNNHAPSGHNDDFVFDTPEFTQNFMANEAANQMLAFDDSPWSYHLEWYYSDMMTAMGSGRASMMTMGDVEYFLNIGRRDNMTMMWTSYFSAIGHAYDMMGTAQYPNIIEGTAYPSTMMMMMTMMTMPFVPGDVLTAMLTIYNNRGREITIPVAQTCYITSPLSDPGYPGYIPVPTLSQWGILVLALFVAFFSFTVIRRRPRTGNS